MALSGGIGIGPGGITGGVTVGVGPISASLGIGAGGISMSGGISGFSPGLFVPNKRSIGGIVAQVTIQEQERDELTVTEHPVEQGAPINDHAFKRPSEVTIRAGWSAQWAGDLSATGGGVYAYLLGLQASVQPFTLYTGKRVYPDMLIGTLAVTTDNHSEFALMADITCRQIILVRTSTGTAQQQTENAKDDHKETTGGEDKKGSQQPRDAGNGFNQEQLGNTVPQSTGAPTAAETAGNIEQGNVSDSSPEANKVVQTADLNGTDASKLPDAKLGASGEAVPQIFMRAAPDYQKTLREHPWPKSSRSQRNRAARSRNR